jgi:spermidine synthase
MKKWLNLEETQTPDGSTLSLHQHDDTLVIRVNGRELMSTRHFASEEKLGEIACSPYKDKVGAKVLIGGLGLGFTLRAALANLHQSAQVIVAELMPEIVTWNKKPEYKLAAASLADPRTRVLMDDVGTVIGRSAKSFDAIMLDADNGTTAMSTQGNSALYESHGLYAIQAALKPGGIVVYWSAQEDPLFVKKMHKSGFKVEVQKVRSHHTSGGKHTLILGRNF